MVALWAVIAYFLGLQVHRSSASGCQHGEMKQGFKVTSAVYREDRGVSLYRCIAHCQMTKTCESINYHTRSKSCGLLDTDVPSLSRDEGYIFVPMKSFHKSLEGRCSKFNCSSGKKCIVNRLHRASCVVEHEVLPALQPTTGCGNPRVQDNASVTVTGRDVGDVATYSCNPGKMMCGAPTVECQAAGRWTTSDFRCQSEYVPVVEWMAACLLTKESSVVLTEIEHAMQVVTIEIESQDTIDNHPRLEILLDAKEAKWFKGGGTSWIQLETYKFQADGRITLNITFTADRIEVRTNGILHPKERVDMLEEAYNIVISSSKDTDAIRVSNCCE